MRDPDCRAGLERDCPQTERIVRHSKAELEKRNGIEISQNPSAVAKEVEGADSRVKQDIIKPQRCQKVITQIDTCFKLTSVILKA